MALIVGERGGLSPTSRFLIDIGAFIKLISNHYATI